MPTKKELLEDLEFEIERLTNTERDNIDALERYRETHIESSENFERAVERLQDSQWQNAESIESAAKYHGDALVKASDTIESAAETLLVGLIGSAVISLTSGIVNIIGGIAMLAIEQIIERIKEINKKTDMINSILKLQQIHPYLTYRFIIERSYASNADREERQTCLLYTSDAADE